MDLIDRQAAIDALKNDMASLDQIIKGMSANDVRLDAYVSQRNQVNYDIYTILFRPKVAAVQPLSRSVKVLVDATTAARSIVVQYSVDGQTWTTRNYRNIGYKGPVACIRKWQIKLHAKENYHSSWCARQFKQGGATLDYKKTASLRSPMAQLYFDDTLIDGIRKEVGFPVLLNIPARAKLVKIRYVYTVQKKDLFSYWLTVKVR